MTTTATIEGERRKLAAQALLQARREVYVLRGRRALLAVLLERGTGTADDVRGAVELPADVNPVCLGAVPGDLVRAGIIRRDGFATTTRAAAHARPVSLWRLCDRGAALAWLLTHPDQPDPAPDEPQENLFNVLDQTTNNSSATVAADALS